MGTKMKLLLTLISTLLLAHSTNIPKTCENCKYNRGDLSSNKLIVCDSHKGFVPNRICGRWGQK